MKVLIDTNVLLDVFLAIYGTRIDQIGPDFRGFFKSTYDLLPATFDTLTY